MLVKLASSHGEVLSNELATDCELLASSTPSPVDMDSLLTLIKLVGELMTGLCWRMLIEPYGAPAETGTSVGGTGVGIVAMGEADVAFVVAGVTGVSK